jgi:hypothetical protein
LGPFGGGAGNKQSRLLASTQGPYPTDGGVLLPPAADPAREGEGVLSGSMALMGGVLGEMRALLQRAVRR